MDPGTEGNKEINDALDEYNMKANDDKIPGATQSSASYSSEAPRIVQKVIKYSHGLIKTETQANFVLFGLVVIMLVVSVILFLSGPPEPVHRPTSRPSETGTL